VSDQPQGWIGVDLDGTLARYDGWKGIEHIGAPIEPIQRLVWELLDAGIEVRIFTARMQNPEALPYIQDWCAVHLGGVLPVTDRKDFSMTYLIDDRTITVEVNTGRFLHAVPDIIEGARTRWTDASGAPPTSFVPSAVSNPQEEETSHG